MIDDEVDVSGGEQVIEGDAPRERVVERVVPREQRAEAAAVRAAEADAAMEDEANVARDAARKLIRDAMKDTPVETDDGPAEETADEPVEAPAAAKPDAPKPDAPAEPKHAATFAKIAREQAEIRRQRAELAPIVERGKAVDAALDLIDAGDIEGGIAALGKLKGKTLTYEALSLSMLKKKPTAAADPATSKRIEQLEAKLAAAEAAEKTAAQTAEATKAKASFLGSLKAATTADEAAKDRYELVLAHGDEGIEVAYEVMSQHFERTEQLMPLSEALDKVEAYYLTQAQKFVAAKKLRGGVNPAAPKQAATAAAPQARPGQSNADGPRTLTSSLEGARTPEEPDDGLQDPSVYRDRARKALRSADTPTG